MKRKQEAVPDFDLEEFIPYLLNQAAEATSRAFQTIYTEQYGMTRTQWRVLANLGKFGSMTAKTICGFTNTEKTKVSRAIAALEAAGLLQRETNMDDRRVEKLQLTEAGLAAFRHLGKFALQYNGDLRTALGWAKSDDLVSTLKTLISNKIL